MAGIVLNGEENPDNREALERYGRVPILGWVPPLQEISRQALRRVFEEHFDKTYFPHMTPTSSKSGIRSHTRHLTWSRSSSSARRALTSILATAGTSLTPSLPGG